MQTSAEAEAKQADIRSKHLQKQLAEQQKGLHGKQNEAAKLQTDLANEEAAVQACQSRCPLYHELCKKLHQKLRIADFSPSQSALIDHAIETYATFFAVCHDMLRVQSSA